MAEIATGLTLTLETDTWAIEIVGVTGNGESYPVLPIPHMGSVDVVEKTTGDLLDQGDVTINVYWDEDKQPPQANRSQDFTITFRVPEGQAAGATRVGKGRLTNVTWDQQVEEVQSGTATLTWLQKVVKTPSAAT